MLFFSKLSKPERSATIEHPQQDLEKTDHNDGGSKAISDGKTGPVDVFGVVDNVQAGVQAMEAATTVWTKGHLITAYIMYVEQRQYPVFTFRF